MLLTAVNRTAPTRVCTRKGRDIVASFVLGVMESEKNNEIDLAKWLSGELTPEEKLAFEQSEDYKAYAKIVNATEKLKDPAYDEDAVLAKIKEKIASQPKVRKLNLKVVYGIAASLVLFFGLYFFMNSAKNYFQTDFGQQIALTLPDGSEVTLNSKSTLYYDKDTFNKDRTLRLDGEAYFKITKGSPFKVVTEEGIVEVLQHSLRLLAQGHVGRLLLQIQDDTEDLNDTSTDDDICIL